MSEKRTVLDIPTEMLEFAKVYGAKWDKVRREHYVEGDVPNELLSFVPQVKRVRDYVNEATEKCTCGCQMVLRTGPSGEPLWKCTSPRCPRWKPVKDLVAPHNFTAQKKDSSSLSDQYQSSERANALLRRVKAQFTNQIYATRWLTEKKIKLRGYGEVPLEAMKTLAGCAKVEELLDELYM